MRNRAIDDVIEMMQTTTEQTQETAFTPQAMPATSVMLPTEASRHETVPQATVSQQEVDALLAIIEQEAKRRKSKTRLATGALIVFSLYFFMAFVARFVFGIKGLFFNPGAFGGIFVAMTAFSQKQKDATKALAQFDDIRGVVAFTEALDFNDKEVTAIAEQKLIHLLPRLQASDSALLDAAHRAILNKKLLIGNANLVLAILKAYQQVGDSTALANVETLSRGTKKWDEASDVVQAARTCLPFLQAHIAQIEAQQTLLRASAESSTAPDILLRPAAPTQDTQSETLLRATNG